MTRTDDPVVERFGTPGLKDSVAGKQEVDKNVCEVVKQAQFLLLLEYLWPPRPGLSSFPTPFSHGSHFFLL